MGGRIVLAFVFISYCWVFFVEELGGGGGSVRRRNTLHVVGGRQLSLSQARFTGREKYLLLKIINIIRNIKNDKINKT
jgi:hypothetical protein